MMSTDKTCVICGKHVGDDPGGVMHVYPNSDGSSKIEYFCAEHNPNPPTPEQLADRERQEEEAGIATLRSEDALIREMVNADRPVSIGDRANIGMLLLRALDRFIWQENRWRALEGKPPIPSRMEWQGDHQEQ